MLTGDSLFVGDIARPDLAVEKAEGARGIFASLRALLELGDDVEVWPGHLGGSLCGGPAMDLKVCTTIGYERRHNALLGVGDEGEFVARADRGPAPAAAELQVDRGDQPRPAGAASARRRAADPAPGRAEQRAGDRHPHRAAVRRGPHPGRDLQHRPAVGLRHPAGLDRRARTTPVVLVGRDDDDALRAVELAAAVGVGPDRGLPRGRDDELARGAPADPVDRPPDRPRAARARRRAARSSTCASATSGRPATSPARASRPTTTSARSRTSWTPTRPIAVVCASGQRAAVGASLIQRYGAREVFHVVDGGVPAWTRGRLAGRALASTHGRPTPSRPSRRLGYDPAQRLRRGRALPPDVHDPAAFVGRDDAARARAVARRDELEPARAGP